MASYETSASDVTTAIDESLAAGAVSEQTATAIKEIVDSLATAGDAVTIDQATTNIVSAADVTAPVVMMAADTKANVTFGADSPVKAMVVGGAGDSVVKFETSDNVTVQLQGGNNDSVSTGAGDDSITFAGGTATIDTGEGNDTVVLQGGTDGGEATVTGGSGNMTVNIDFDLADTNVKATVDAGDGFDGVAVGGSRAEHFFEFVNGFFRMVKNAVSAHDDGVRAAAEPNAYVDMTNVNVVTFTDDAGEIADITILADTAGEALVGRLYQVALGRQAIDLGADGKTELTTSLDYWTNEFGAGNEMSAEQLDHMARAIVNSDEFVTKYGDMNGQEFANAMFANLNDVATQAGLEQITQIGDLTVDDFAAAINNNTMSMQDVAIQIANSNEAIQLLGDAQYIITAPDIAG